MNWIVDTCIVIDILENDPEFGLVSANFLEGHLSDGLEISPITLVELAPAFHGDLEEQKTFLRLAGIQFENSWSVQDTEEAHRAWHRHIMGRRKGNVRKRPVADLLIGAFAMNRRGLITRNAGDFRKAFPDLNILEP